jgi:hypothetical protein
MLLVISSFPVGSSSVAIIWRSFVITIYTSVAIVVTTLILDGKTCIMTTCGVMNSGPFLELCVHT